MLGVMLASIRHALDHSAPRLLFCRCVLGFRLQGAGMRAKCSDACSYRAVSHCVHTPRRPRTSRFGFRRRPRASAIAAILSGALLLLCTMHYLVLFRDMPLGFSVQGLGYTAFNAIRFALPYHSRSLLPAFGFRFGG